MTAGDALKRELRVALSRRAQPLGFRLLKWATIITVAVMFWGHPYFWWWVLGLVALALTLHFL